jgi:transcriptional regulator with XRE-family HTH domain
MPKVTAAALLSEARERAGMTQRELAQRAKTTQSVVARIENGQTVPGWDTLQALLHAAGYELGIELRQRPHVEPGVLAEAKRILRLSPTDRIREVANVSRFIGEAKRV